MKGYTVFNVEQIDSMRGTSSATLPLPTITATLPHGHFTDRLSGTSGR